jgi:NAD+ synthase (glutamine-hydrolysing)
VFDERRYFTPGLDHLVVDRAGSRLGITVCEDVWIDPGPCTDLARAGARVVLNLSASPFHEGKGESREAMLVQRARENDVWLVYCNMVGGQDELVFDGRSVVIAPDGTIVARAAAFEEELLIVEIGDDVLEPVGTVADRMDSDVEEVWNAIVLGVRDYVHKSHRSNVVLGMSGGIDSAAVAVIAVDALGPDAVWCVTMPSQFTSGETRGDAEEVADRLGVRFEEIAIEPMVQAALSSLGPLFGDRPVDSTEENIQARMRANVLMAISNKFGPLVLSTSNKSESSVGYTTLYGDMAGAFTPLQDVPKTLLYRMARWRNEQAMAQGVAPPFTETILTRPPTAELRANQKDSDSLPPYDVLDQILERYVERDESTLQIAGAGFDFELVVKIAAMVDCAEHKRRQAPPGVKIRPRAFGRDRRMPIVNRYRG